MILLHVGYFSNVGALGMVWLSQGSQGSSGASSVVPDLCKVSDMDLVDLGLPDLFWL